MMDLLKIRVSDTRLEQLVDKIKKQHAGSNKPFAIESARLLLEYIFDEDEIRKDQTSTELEQRILM